MKRIELDIMAELITAVSRQANTRQHEGYPGQARALQELSQRAQDVYTAALEDPGWEALRTRTANALQRDRRFKSPRAAFDAGREELISTVDDFGAAGWEDLAGLFRRPAMPFEKESPAAEGGEEVSHSASE